MAKNNYSDFRALSPTERKKILKSEDFRSFLLDYKSDAAIISEIMRALTPAEIHILYDEDFCDAVKTSNNRNTIFPRLADSLSDDAVKEFGKSDDLKPWLQIPIFTSSVFKKFDIFDKFRLLNECILDINYHDAYLEMSKCAYPNPNREIEIFMDVNYKNNLVANSIMDIFVNENPRIAQVYLNDVALLATLDRYTIKNLYKDKSFSDLTENEKNIIFSALQDNIQIVLPEKILFDSEFINRIVFEENPNTYRRYIENLPFYNPSIVDTIKEKRNKYCEECLSDSYIDGLSPENDLNDLSEILFNNYFEASEKDCFLTACMIKDACDHNLKDFEKYISPYGKEVVDIIVAWFEELITYGAQKSPIHKINDIHETDTSEINRKYIKKLYPLLKDRPDLAIDYSKLFNISRTLFEKELNKNLNNTNKTLSGGNAKIVHREYKGLPVYDISDLDNYYLLVHSGRINDAHVLDNNQYQNISMSVLDNNHHKVYNYDEYDKENNIIYGYENLDQGSLLHACLRDSFTICNNAYYGATKKSQLLTDFVPSYLNLPDFMRGTSEYNELKVRAFSNAQNEFGERIMKPSYIVCKDTITNFSVQEAKRFNIPIVFFRDQQKVYPIDNSVSTVERLAKYVYNTACLKYDEESKFAATPEVLK